MFVYFNSPTQTAVLSMMYITALGYGLVSAGIYVHEIAEQHVDVPTAHSLLFAGGFIAALGWVSLIWFAYNVI